MLFGHVPGAEGLFFAVDADCCGHHAISATGVHHTLCGARWRCVMERLECTAIPASKQALGDANLSASGSAAAPCRTLAETRASEEAMERLLCGLWWSGRLAPSLPPHTVIDAAMTALQDWRCAQVDLPDLITLDVTGFAPVVVAIVAGPDGRGLCCGTAGLQRPAPPFAKHCKCSWGLRSSGIASAEVARPQAGKWVSSTAPEG